MDINNEDDFDRHFTLVKNQLCDDASWNGCLFEIFGDEVQYVFEQPEAHVWTWIEGSETEDTFLVSGRHYVNRIGYLITKEAVSDDAFFEINLEQEV